ncbi:MAG: acylphosphatase [Candidatus Harrisonbacteria bacterium CG10_big_fil_rev_8_21_14_0_10_42_17]|uniref:acylphosphatase n=1 Tax=Candidatus Harrisonbacteria bacterium CG10_big_fil_rev_8_21_14_0_10_42_17 TaxID=1974584 RepID=A0A2M6WHJ8_9BACT|nr:MAG: acylphosphatase [Candidatus Harrisonbacteria bacterium CG10_big_fil_rev_8_21_14_0_10_42_17]
MNEHLTIRVYGEVQGVFYRTSAQEEAVALDLVGVISNETDGSVLIEAEGSREYLERFLEWCKAGPPSAHVTRITSTFYSDLQGYEDFVIR